MATIKKAIDKHNYPLWWGNSTHLSRRRGYMDNKNYQQITRTFLRLSRFSYLSAIVS
ncbi:hypothetical protein RVW32_001370 [Citrobacter amalonaticus]|nr:hypothetical protein [Citrobacter amalonaticus]